jgi:beta-glucosidase
MTDMKYICKFGSIYRCGVDWARLQTSPMADFDQEVVEEYQLFFQALNDKGVRLMFVLHHFAHPIWFEEKGGWTKELNQLYFSDFCRRCIQHFGPYTEIWNTFNEPNVFAMNAYMLGNFPPFRKNYFVANRVLRIMGKAHRLAYQMIKAQYPEAQVGISFNTAAFKGRNVIGWLPAQFTSWWFNRYSARPFKNVDFWGISYYALIYFDPRPITEIDRPGKLKALGIPHDNMWAYYPKGLAKILNRFHRRFKKPIWITENGICTNDPDKRIEAIKDYLQVCKESIDNGVDLRGYIHWSTIDNFEWHLGPSYRFGLVKVDRKSWKRAMTPAGAFYAKVVAQNGI